MYVIANRTIMFAELVPANGLGTPLVRKKVVVLKSVKATEVREVPDWALKTPAYVHAVAAHSLKEVPGYIPSTESEKELSVPVPAGLIIDETDKEADLAEEVTKEVSRGRARSAR